MAAHVGVIGKLPISWRLGGCQRCTTSPRLRGCARGAAKPGSGWQIQALFGASLRSHGPTRVPMPSFLKRVARPSDAEPSVFADAGEGRVGAVSTNSLQPIIFSLFDNGPSVRWETAFRQMRLYIGRLQNLYLLYCTEPVVIYVEKLVECPSECH